MLQKKDYQQKQQRTPTKIPVIPTIKNVTKEGLPTTTTIKKPIVENQTSGKIKTNVTKEGLHNKNTRTPTTPTIKKPIVENQTYW